LRRRGLGRWLVPYVLEAPRRRAPRRGEAVHVLLCIADHHGAPEANARMLLGEPMVRFHEALARWAGEGPRCHVHYVTAREMFNLVRAAEAGWQGSVAEARDYQLVWNGGRAS